MLRDLTRISREPFVPAVETEDAWTVSWVFAAGPSSVDGARHATADRLARWGLHDRAEAARLLVGELVEAALGTCDRIRLTLMTEDGLLRGEVERLDPVPRRSEGRGHHLLARLACCWGRAATVEGTADWFELPAPASPHA
ncbi:hypothetical protein [Nonomuraea indica]|uniref:ATP-binding protein n=1 Tax=Nonomuraea indica TaxID=1581193 RepID=A0ABW7ZZJ4_9ACTN|nr:hypothetical protein [Nonomuraea indica]